MPLDHPCFNAKAHRTTGRIHLAVAPKCNIQCRYCDRKYDCANESRPGVTSAVLTPDQAMVHLEEMLTKEPRIRVAGIAGPGEPLYNPETFETFRRIRKAFPDLILCVSTNGLLLPEKLEELVECGISTLTVTMNTLHTETAENIYHFPGTSAEKFLQAQQEGVHAACASGLTVKINTVLIPGINETEAEEIAKFGKQAGAAVMNLMPLIPCGEMKENCSPSPEIIHQCRRQAGIHLPQFYHCRQCRADACGVPGEEAPHK